MATELTTPKPKVMSRPEVLPYSHLEELLELCARAMQKKEIPETNGSPSSPETDRQYRVSAAYEFNQLKVDHKTYKGLRKSAYFRVAEKAFIAFAKKNPCPRRIHCEFYELTFLTLFLAQLNLFCLNSATRDLHDYVLYPDTRTLTSAQKHIAALRNLKHRGLRSFEDWPLLSSSMDRFSRAIEESIPLEKRRSKKNDKKSAGKYFVENLAYDFLLHFENPLRDVLLNLAAYIGYSNTDSVIDQRIACARTKLRDQIDAFAAKFSTDKFDVT